MRIKNMWLKKLFGFKTVSKKQVKKDPLKNEDAIQFESDKKLTKNKWLNPRRQLWKTKERNRIKVMYR